MLHFSFFQSLSAFRGLSLSVRLMEKFLYVIMILFFSFYEVSIFAGLIIIVEQFINLSIFQSFRHELASARSDACRQQTQDKRIRFRT